MCPALDVNGATSFPTALANTTVEGVCEPAYAPLGGIAPKQLCLATGQWSGIILGSCQRTSSAHADTFVCAYGCVQTS
jgi:hypothetical protein